MDRFRGFPKPFRKQPRIKRIVLQRPNQFRIFSHRRTKRANSKINGLRSLSKHYHRLRHFNELFPLNRNRYRTNSINQPTLYHPKGTPLPRVPTLFQIGPMILRSIPHHLFATTGSLLFKTRKIVVFPNATTMLRNFTISNCA